MGRDVSFSDSRMEIIDLCNAVERLGVKVDKSDPHRPQTSFHYGFNNN